MLSEGTYAINKQANRYQTVADNTNLVVYNLTYFLVNSVDNISVNLLKENKVFTKLQITISKGLWIKFHIICFCSQTSDLMDDPVQFICGDANSDILRCSVHHFSCQLRITLTKKA